MTQPIETSHSPPPDYPAELCWPPQWLVGTEFGPKTYHDSMESADAAADAARIWAQVACVTSPILVTPRMWHHRERCDQQSRVMPVWSGMPFWNRPDSIQADHYVAVSETDPALLSYIQNNAKGQRGIRTPIKPGKYLTKYYSDVLTAREIAGLATWQATGVKVTTYNDPAKYVLKFASTPEDIVKVYLTGPDSCMAHPTHFYSSSVHPTTVYGAGDLQIAYLTEAATGRIRARALVWPDKLHCGRVYPTDHCWSQDGFDSLADCIDMQAALTDRFRALGYSMDNEKPNGFDGARLTRINCGGRVVMPYLDGDYGYDVGSGSLTMESSFDYSAETTNGLSDSRHDGSWDDDDDEDDEGRGWCERCEESCDQDDTQSVVTRVRSGRLLNEQTWCEHCARNHAFYCSGLEELVCNNQESIEVGNQTFSQDWAEHNDYWQSECGDCDWYTPDTARIELDNGEVWTADEFETHGFTCVVLGTLHEYSSSNRHAVYEGACSGVTDDAWQDHLGESLAGGDTNIIQDNNQLELELAA